MPGIEAIANSRQLAHRAETELGRLKQSARQVVGSVFYGTLLKSMRESSFKGKYGHGGRGEEVFSAQLHNVLAEKMGAATEGGLADVLYDRLRAQQERMTAMRDDRGAPTSSPEQAGPGDEATSKRTGPSNRNLF